MMENKELIGLVFDDFSRLHYLDSIEAAPNLRYLSYGNKVSASSYIMKIGYLKDCQSLEAFQFIGKTIFDAAIEDFLVAPRLRVLDFPTNLFEMESVAKLVALAPHLEGCSLRPYIKIDRENTDKDVLIVRRENPFLHSVRDKEKMEKYKKAFDSRVNQYKNDISLRNWHLNIDSANEKV